MHNTLLAEIPQSFQNLTEVGLKLFVVLPIAFVVGYILTAMLVKVGCKYTIKRQFPHPLQRLFRIIGGVLLALIVALFIFGEGGWGTGWGDEVLPGQGEGKTEETPTKKEIEKTPSEIEEPKDPPEPKSISAERIEVTILGGFDEGERYYRLPESDRRLTLGEVTQMLEERIQDKEHPLTEVAILVYKDSAARDNPVVLRLENWVRRANLGVVFPPVQDQKIPRNNTE